VQSGRLEKILLYIKALRRKQESVPRWEGQLLHLKY